MFISLSVPWPWLAQISTSKRSSPGEIARRDLEKLGQSDVGIILFRQVLEEQIDKVERGQDPMNVIRDAAQNDIIELPRERVHHGNRRQFERAGGDSYGGNAATAGAAARSGGRPTPTEARELLQRLRGEAVLEGIEPIEAPAFEITPIRAVTADLA
jgi:hypothetical protein